MKVEDLINEQ